MLACFGKTRSAHRRDEREGKAFRQAGTGLAHSTWASAAEVRHSLGHVDLSSGAKLALTHLSDTILEAKAYLLLLAGWIAQDMYFANLLECFHKQVQSPGTLQPRTFILNLFSSRERSTCGLSMKLRVQITHLRSLVLEHLPQEQDSFTWQPVKHANGIDVRLETDGLQGWYHAGEEHSCIQACSASEFEAAGATAAAVPPPLPPPSQGPTAPDHRRSALMLLEVPASITLFLKDGLVLDQNQGSIEQYGPILGEKMWRAKNVEGKALQELQVCRGQGLLMSGPLPKLFGPNNAGTLRDLLEHISRRGVGPWRCTIPVGPRATATATSPNQQRSKSLNSLAHESGCSAPQQPVQPNLHRPSSVVVQSNRLASQMTLRDQATGSFTAQQTRPRIGQRHSCSNLIRRSQLQLQPPPQQEQQQQQQQQQHKANMLDGLEEALQQQQQTQKLQTPLQAFSFDRSSVPTYKHPRPHSAPRCSRTWSDLRDVGQREGLPTLSEDKLHRESTHPNAHKHHCPKRRHTFHAFQHKQQQKRQQQQEQQRQQVALVKQSCGRSPQGPPGHSTQSSVEGKPKEAGMAQGLCHKEEEATEQGSSKSGSSPRKRAALAAVTWGPVDVPGISCLVGGRPCREIKSEVGNGPSKRVSREESSRDPREEQDEDEEEEEEELEEEVYMEHQEVEMRPVMDPITNQPACLLIQRDVTEQAKLEKLLSQMTEDQLQMLSQIFPRHVIEALSTGVLTTENLAAMAKKHTDVTIVFLDIVGFTAMSKDVHAEEVILFLNLLFTRFDRLLTKHQMQKVDTIGDCFIASSGILAPDQDGFMSIDEHHNPSLGAGRALALAIDMMRTAAEVQMPNKEPVRLRIGIHTGPCVSGLCGVETPKWSVFGDTVNTAARMEQTAGETCIQISSTTYDLLPKHTGIELQPSGGVAMKGKGVVDTWVWHSPSGWTSTARESNSGTGKLPLSAERLYQFCYQPERGGRQPYSNPPSSLRLPRLWPSKQSVDESREPSPTNSGHQRALTRSIAPLTDALAASLQRSLLTHTSSITSVQQPSDSGFTTTAAFGGRRTDSVLNLQGLVMLVESNDSGTNYAPHTSRGLGPDSRPHTPFAVIPCSASSAEVPSEAAAATETGAHVVHTFANMPISAASAEVPAKTAAAQTGAPETGAHVVHTFADMPSSAASAEVPAKATVAQTDAPETGAHEVHTFADMPSSAASAEVVLAEAAAAAAEAGAPLTGTSETGTHVMHTLADMPSKRHLASSSALSPQQALQDLEDPATSHSDNSRQAASGAGTYLRPHTLLPLPPQQQQPQQHLQRESSRSSDHQQEQAGDRDEAAVAPPPHHFPPQSQASTSASSQTPSPAFPQDSQAASFAFPHIVLPLHTMSQVDVTPSRSQTPPHSPSPHSPTDAFWQQHHRHPQHPASPHSPAYTHTTHQGTPTSLKKRASLLSKPSWASTESQTEAGGAKSAGLLALDSSNTEATTQESVQDSRSLTRSRSRRNSFLLHLPSSSVVHTHAALLDAELAQHRRKKSITSRPRHAALPKERRKSSFHMPPHTPPLPSPSPSSAQPLPALSPHSLHHPVAAAPEAIKFGEAHTAQIQAEPPQTQFSQRTSLCGVRATAATLAQRAIAQATRPGRVSTEGAQHGSCSSVILPPHKSCSNAIPPRHAAVSQGNTLGGGGGDAASRAYVPKFPTHDCGSDEWDMKPRGRM